MIANNRLLLTDLIKEQIKTLDDYKIDENGNEVANDIWRRLSTRRPITVYDRPENPIDLENPPIVPCLTFGVGDTELIDGDTGVAEQGELFRLVINANIDAWKQKSGVQNPPNPPPAQHRDVVSQVEIIHFELENIIFGIGTPDGFEGSVERSRVVSAEPYTPGLSQTELMRFTVEIEWRQPID